MWRVRSNDSWPPQPAHAEADEYCAGRQRQPGDHGNHYPGGLVAVRLILVTHGCRFGSNSIWLAQTCEATHRDNEADDDQDNAQEYLAFHHESPRRRLQDIFLCLLRFLCNSFKTHEVDTRLTFRSTPARSIQKQG